mgnify:CR=1 FL=1
MNAIMSVAMTANALRASRTPKTSEQLPSAEPEASPMFAIGGERILRRDQASGFLLVVQEGQPQRL